MITRRAILAYPSVSPAASRALPALVAVLFATVVGATGRCCGAAGRDAGGVGPADAAGRPTRGGEVGDVERQQMTKVALNLLKTLHLDEPPAAPSDGSLEDIRRMVKIDQGIRVSPPAYGGTSAAVSRLSALLLQRDEGGDSEQDSMLYIKGEKGPDGQTLVFTLAPKDRPFRVTTLRLNVYVPPPGEPQAKVNSSSPRYHHYRDARQLQGLKVDVVHRSGGSSGGDAADDEDVKMERVHSSAVLATHGWYRVVLPVQAVGGQLTRDGRVELRLMCAHCPGGGIGTRQSHDPSHQQQQHDSLVYLVVVGRKPAPRPSAVRDRGDCDSGCCLRELTVDFDQLGPRWYWVLKPRRFQANYCWGSCAGQDSAARAANQSATSAVLSTMLRHLGVEDNPSCCVPSSTTPVEVLYLDGDGTARLDRHGLSTVTGCACN